MWGVDRVWKCCAGWRGWEVERDRDSRGRWDKRGRGEAVAGPWGSWAAVGRWGVAAMLADGLVGVGRGANGVDGRAGGRRGTEKRGRLELGGGCARGGRVSAGHGCTGGQGFRQDEVGRCGKAAKIYREGGGDENYWWGLHGGKGFGG